MRVGNSTTGALGENAAPAVIGAAIIAPAGFR